MDFNREMPGVIAKMPLIVKILIGVTPVLLGGIYVILMNGQTAKNGEQFYKREFSSIVLRSNVDAFSGRVTEFHLENGLKIYFGLSVKNTIAVGDSIKKNSNTYLYDVYRKDVNGEYNFWATYDFEKVY